MQITTNKRVSALLNHIRSIHWVDIAIIGVFFTTLAMVFFFFLRRVEYITVRFRVTQSDGLKNYLVWDMPPLWYSTVLKPGMEDKDFLGRSIIKIERVISSLPEDNEQKIYVDLRVQALYNRQTKQYSYNGTPLLIGSYQRLKINGIQIPGVIHAIDDLGKTTYPQKKYLLYGYLDHRFNDWPPGVTNNATSEIVYDGVYKYVADKIKEGTEMRYGDMVLAKIIKVKKSPGTIKIIQNGRLSIVPDNDRDHVELVTEVTASIINDRPYFKDDQQRILINSAISLDLNYVKVGMLITDLKEEE